MLFSNRKTIGVFVGRTADLDDGAFFAALERESARLDYDVAVFLSAGGDPTADGYDLQEKAALTHAPLEKLDGLLVCPSGYPEGEFRDLVYSALAARARVPLVVCGEDAAGYDRVLRDPALAMRTLTRHLIGEHRLTDLRLLTGSGESPEEAALLEGFLREMADCGLAVPESAVCRGGRDAAAGALRAFFSDPAALPQAVICTDGALADALLRALGERGLRVPEDVRVAAVENRPDRGLTGAGLAAVRPDDFSLVARALDLLDRRIRGEAGAEEAVRLPGRLVPEESCGCVRRSPADYHSMINRLLSQRAAERAQDAAMNRVSVELGSCANLSDLHRALVSRQAALPSVRDHYICLFGTPEKPEDPDSDAACLVHAVRDHLDAGMPMIRFDRADLLPPMAGRDEPQVLYVRLLHQSGRSLGYSVFHYDRGVVPSRCYLQANIFLSIALDSIHRQRVLRDLYEERRLSSTTDHMTGLLNRRGLLESVEPLWPAMTGRDIAFICIDMDYLKHTNDNFGHAAGDVAIGMIGRAMKKAMPETALGARIGGDEFIIFLPDAGGDRARELVHRFNKILTELNREEKRSFTVSASVGFKVVRPDRSTTVEECIRASDRILYQIKESRPDKIVRAGWNKWKVQEMPVPFGMAATTAPYYAKPCDERLAALPEALMKLAEDGYTWEHGYVAGKPDYALTLMDYPNIYSFLHTHDLDPEAVRRVLSDASLMVHRRAFTPEEIDLLLGDDPAKALAHFASPSTIVIGENGYCAKWMYDHAASTWFAEGITPGMVIKAMPHYYNPLFVQKAADAFSRKLYQFTGIVMPVKWNQWKEGDLKPDGSVAEGGAASPGPSLDVMEYCQYSDYPTGCEIVSLYMLLHFYGVQVTVDQIIDRLPLGAQPYDDALGVRHGANPEREFVGDPRNQISYGVFNGPVARVAEQLLPGMRTRTGATLDDIRAILKGGNPVMAWYVSAPMRPIMYRWSWLDERGETVCWPGGEHAVVLCGCDDVSFTYRDPNAGTTVEVDCDTFEKSFAELGGRIIWYAGGQPA